MAGDFPFVAKVVSPAKCNEKPWDLWVNEIGHSSPRQDDEGSAVFAAPASADGKSAPRRDHPYKPGAVAGVAQRYRRAGLNRLRHDSMSLHGLFPQMDNLNAAICHMCGLVVKCSAAYRHLLESHTGSEPILPPPPPAPTVKLKSGHSRSRHKKELPPPPPPLDILPVPIETSLYTTTPPLSRIVIPQPELQYLEEPGTSSAVTAEVQVCVETGELPVVSIQDTEDLPLGENITDDIVDIMNSEGIQSADDITNAADWKNIIRDIGKMQDLNFPQTTDTVQTQDLFTPVDPTLTAYAMTDTDLSSLQFAPNTSPMLASVMDTTILNAQALKPVAPSTPTSKAQRPKSKSKFNLREYDPNKHCGVVTVDNPKPCTRSLTCKAHALSLRRTVEGRVKPFDTLLAEHRAAAPAARAPAAASGRRVARHERVQRPDGGAAGERHLREPSELGGRARAARHVQHHVAAEPAAGAARALPAAGRRGGGRGARVARARAARGPAGAGAGRRVLVRGVPAPAGAVHVQRLARRRRRHARQAFRDGPEQHQILAVPVAVQDGRREQLLLQSERSGVVKNCTYEQC